MKKNISRLPDSELDIMLVLWKHQPPMSRMEIEKVVNEKKTLAPTTILSFIKIGEKELCGGEQRGKNESVYTADFPGGIPAEGEQKRS